MQVFDTKQFQEELLDWYEDQKRDLPWRRERDPYRIWVSEIMLQQTKVDTVIPYFHRFMEAFPTLEALATAEEQEVLKQWEGLGYYSRARNLHQAVQEVQEYYGGNVPDTEEEIKKLRGVGPYTAGAVLSIAYGVPAPAVDGNVMRVLSRIFSIYDDVSKVSTRKRFEAIIRSIIAEEAPSDFNQGLMELGAVICTPTSPGCLICPVQAQCAAKEEGAQELLPVKPKKKPPKTQHLTAGVLVDREGNVLVEKRPDTGLLAKLWQFPNVPQEEEDSLFPPEAVIKDPSWMQVRHVFSHLVWEVRVVYAEIDAVDAVGERQRMVSMTELEDLPFSVSHQKILQSLKKQRQGENQN
ncbi:A/G-specific adenine glycosylase [Alkalicoccus chagannorensis]|uniref:A/G-specific adenine glycosylase n=1 Tax=Alkalicoccus chagannorensis TaxID=427072 RepID=UPI0003FF4582|nr:A/G-specific adenine glycosylase [Alkalicoccus chagannorensis]